MSNNRFVLPKGLVTWRSLKALVAIGMLSLSCPRTAFGGSNGLVIYQGRIARPDGGTLSSGNVTFALSIYSPAPTQCLLYSETQVVNMSGSLGMFSLQLGAGTRTDGGSHSFNDVFVNGKTLSSLTCVSGSTYTGGPADDRDLRVSFNDSGTIVNLSSMAIKSVPFALQAHEIDGWGLNNLVKVSSTGSPTTLTTAEMANVKMLGAASCATNEILKWNGSAWGCSADATGGSPADAGYTGTKGVLAFDTDALTSGITVASGIAKLSNTGVTAATYGTAAKVPAIAINAQGRITTASEIPISIPFTQITGGSASAGDVLKWNGSAWLPAADATGTSPGDASFAAKGLVQGDTDAATSGLNISSGVISVNSGIAANQIVKLDASAKLPAVDGSQITNLSASQVSSGTIPVSRGGTGSVAALSNNKVMVSSGGAIVEGNGFGSTKANSTFVVRDGSGNFAAGVGTFDSLKLNGATSGTLTLTVPSSFTSFSLNLPSADGSAGQLLKTDGSGNLTWATVAGAPSDASYSVKGIFQADTDATTSGLSFSSSGVLKVNAGTGANQIVKLDAASKLPAVDGSAMTNLSANNIASGTLPISRGGTGASTKAAAFDALSPNSAKGDITVHNGTNNISLPRGSDGQVLTTDSAQASGLKWANAAAGTVTSVTGGTGLTGGTITSAGTLAVDVGTGANQIVQMTASSKLPAVDGSALTNLSANNITSGTLPVSRGGTGTSSFAGDNLVGTNTTGTALQAVTCAQNQVLSFDASGKYGCYNLSAIAGGTYFANGGNGFGGATSLGTNDSYALNFKTNNTAWMTIDTAGNVGIGTSAPSSNLHVFQNSNVAASSNPAALFSVQMMSGEPEWGIPRLNYALMLQDRGTGATAGPAIGFKTTDGIGASISMSEVQTAQGGSLEFNTSADSTTTSTRMVILNTGNVGIGTTSPAAKLHVSGGHIAVDNNKTVAFFDNSATNTIGSYLSLTTGNNFQIINLTSAGNTQYQNLNNTGAHIFYTGVGGTERMRITSAGNIGIGTATPAAKLEVNGDITADSLSTRAGSGMDLHLTSDNSGAVDLYDGVNNHALSIFNGATVKTQIWATGSSYFNGGNVGIGTTTPSYKLHVVGTAGLSTGTAWTNASDIRLKDIDGDYEYGLDEILKLHTVRFHYKKDNALNIPSDHPMTGFIAQEVQKVIPDAVHVRDDGYLELNVDPIHWATVNAVQQLHGMCKMTETQMQMIKAKVESHDRRIASVETVNRRLENENEILRKKNEKLETQVSSLTLGMRTLKDENKKMKDDIQYILQKLSERK